MKGRVLVVDDDAALAEMLGIVLRGEGFEPVFVADGDKALEAFRDNLRPDLVLLDLMLPGTDGYRRMPSADQGRVGRADRHAGRPRPTPVDVVVGLGSRARTTTYSSRSSPESSSPGSPRGYLRRTDDPAPEMLQIGDVAIDVAGHFGEAQRRDAQLTTPLGEFDLLVALARKLRQVFTREVLLEQVWGLPPRGRHAARERARCSGCGPRSRRTPSTPRSSSPCAASDTRRDLADRRMEWSAVNSDAVGTPTAPDPVVPVPPPASRIRARTVPAPRRHGFAGGARGTGRAAESSAAEEHREHRDVREAWGKDGPAPPEKWVRWIRQLASAPA